MTTDRDADQVQTPYQPSLRDMIMLDEPYIVRLSPNGALLAFTVKIADWGENRYERLCYIHDIESGKTTPLTRGGNVVQIEWLNEHTLAVLWRGVAPWDDAQVWVHEHLIGDGWRVTHHDSGVDWFVPFADGILYRADDFERKGPNAREREFGKVTHFEQEPSPSALYYVGLPELRAYEKRKRAPSDKDAPPLVEPVIELSKLLPEPLSIRGIVVSPDHDALYLSCRKRDDLTYIRDTSTFRISLDAPAALAEHLERAAAKPDRKAKGNKKKGKKGKKAKKERKGKDRGDKKRDVDYLGQLSELPLPRGAFVTDISPDGRTLLIHHQGRDDKLYTRADLWLIEVEAALAAETPDDFVAAMRDVTGTLDRTILGREWAPEGIFFSYADGTAVRLARIEPSAPEPTPVPLDLEGLCVASAPHTCETGRIAFLAAHATAPEEVYIAERAASDDGQTERWVPRRITNFAAALEGWDLGTVETIEWTSRDGTVIQGVLRKPSDFDPTRRYPLVLVVHGGPAGLSTAYLLDLEDTRYYPAVQFVNKDVLVLKPNYRGSMGRGQTFLELNVNNLGVGDLWDIESGVEHLIDQGFVDPKRVGCMGWSQGGYISAFAGLHSEAFRAVSVGAGISDWYTYYVSNDIPDFTVDYLSGSPFRNRELYNRSAPMSNIANAKTPMLIQHGSEDRRVPLSNAMELYRGLKEMGVPVELYIFPGMGHPITRPRENHAVMHQNLNWFSHYLLDEELKLE